MTWQVSWPELSRWPIRRLGDVAEIGHVQPGQPARGRGSPAALARARHFRAAEDPGYLTETGQAAAEDGSVAPIIGGLPAVEGSARDIGAALEDRGAGLADRPGNSPDQARHQDTRSS